MSKNKKETSGSQSIANRDLGFATMGSSAEKGDGDLTLAMVRAMINKPDKGKAAHRVLDAGINGSANSKSQRAEVVSKVGEVGSVKGRPAGIVTGLSPSFDGFESPSVPRSLGGDDTSVDLNGGECLAVLSKQNSPRSGDSQDAQQVFNKMPQPKSLPESHWVNLFKENRRMGNGLQLPTFEMESDAIMFKEDDLRAPDGWEYDLVGYIAGKRPGKGAVFLVVTHEK